MSGEPRWPQQRSSGGMPAFLVSVFIISLLIPIHFNIADLRLTPYRILLLLLTVPAFIRFVGHPRLTFKAADAVLILFALVGGLSLIVVDGSVASAGIYAAEALGPYFIARAFITNVDEFIRAMKVLFYCIMCLIPFAAYESFTRDPIVLTVLNKFLSAHPNVPHEIRLGMDRAQVVFEHPILYGMFCSMGFASAIYVIGLHRSSRPKYINGILVGIAAFFSLSSGGLVSVGMQAMLLTWDKLLWWFRARWRMLATGVATAYIFVELAANRTAAEIAVSFLAFNAHNAWTRLVVNEFAMQAVYANPIFGLGLFGQFEGPDWLTASIDNFWLVLMFRHGIPTFSLLILCILLVSFGMIRAGTLEPRVAACRSALLITLLAVSISAYTVHFWNATYCMFIFLIGSGVWITERANISR